MKLEKLLPRVAELTGDAVLITEPVSNGGSGPRIVYVNPAFQRQTGYAESEIVGGPFVEYSGAHWSVFFLAEYINTFAVAALTVLLFLGGWSGPFLTGNWEIIWFLAKVYAVILVIFWIRGTFPRLRIDQLMAFAWKVMVPLSFLLVVMTAVYQFYEWPAWSLTAMSSAALLVVGYLVYQRMTGPKRLAAQVRSRQEALEAQRRAPNPVSTQAGGN